MMRRPGFTLTEVVVTLAILAFGILAVLTLFPLAASQMAIAVREDRAGQQAAASAALFRTYWKTEVVERIPIDPPPPATPTPDEDIYRALTDPNVAVDGSFQVNGKGLPRAAADEASYPVVVDPMGWVARPGPSQSQSWFGDGGATNIPRRTLVRTVGTIPAANAAERTRLSLRLCSQMDGHGYTEDGVPTGDRELRYNCLWVVQRPVNGNRFNADLTVVVFGNRPHLFAPTGAEQVLPTVGNVVQDGRTTTVTLDNSTPAGPPNVKPGGWVMDATVNPPGRPKLRQANLYQVVSVTPNGGNTTLELQTPLKPASDGQGDYPGTFVLLPGAVGAYTKPPLTGE